MHPEPILTVPELMRIVGWLMLALGVGMSVFGIQTWRSEVAKPPMAGGNAPQTFWGQDTLCDGVTFILFGANQVLRDVIPENLLVTVFMICVALTIWWRIRLSRQMKRARVSVQEAASSPS